MIAALAVLVCAAAGATAAPAAGAGSSGCPAALAPGTHALRDVLQQAPRLVSRSYRDEPLRGYSIDGAVSLNEYGWAGRELPRLVRLAKHLCGPTVADRSWLLFLSFPAARSINTGSSVAFVARTSHGWVVWHRYFPIP